VHPAVWEVGPSWMLSTERHSLLLVTCRVPIITSRGHSAGSTDSMTSSQLTWGTCSMKAHWSPACLRMQLLIESAALLATS
jgi:hypothetical protein